MKKIVGLAVVLLMAFSVSACNSDLQKKIEDLEAQLQAQTDKITELVQDGIKSPTFKVEDGVLMVTYDNGVTWSELGDIAGADGAEGATPTFKIESGQLLVSYDNGVTWNELDGDVAINPIKSIAFNADGNLVITFMDGSTQVVINEEHCFGDWQLVGGQQAEYCEQQWYYRQCANCEKVDYRQGSQSDHDWTVVTTPYTCTEQGYDTKTCQNCGKTQVENYIQSPGHDWSERFNYDGTHHWRDCLNCDEITDYGEHEEDNGYCSQCDQNYNYSEGLTYTLNSSGTAYTVSGLGSCSDTDLVIRGSYKGLPVTAIGPSAFTRSNITSVTIPNSVTEIGNYAFQECKSLTSVYLPKGVEKLGLMPFIVCDNLVEFIVDEDNGAYKAVDGNLYTKDGSELIQYALGKEQTAFTVPSGVTRISEGAFAYSRLQTIVLPQGLTSLGVAAFAYSYSLDNVTIPSTVTYWGFTTFSYCINLANVRIENGVTSIGEAAFEGCLSLESIELPDSLTNVNKNSFKLCVGLTNITVSSGNTTYKSIDGNVYSADGKTLVLYAPGKTATEFVVPSGVTSIGNYAFANCSNLVSITLSESVQKIEKSAFDGCANLIYNQYDNGYYLGSQDNEYFAFVRAKSTDVISCLIHSDTKIICDYAFDGCDSLTTVDLSNGVKVIGYAAFALCTSLESITLSQSLTSIGDNAFVFCTSLTSVTLPQSLTSIGDYAFAVCTSLASVDIPNSVDSLGMGAFLSCTSLTSVTLSNSLASIGYATFVNCLSLTNITIPSSVTSLGSYAFWGCDRLVSITLPANLTSVADNCFLRCQSLAEILFEGRIDEWLQVSLDADWIDGAPATVVVCSDGRVEI